MWVAAEGGGALPWWSGWYYFYFLMLVMHTLFGSVVPANKLPKAPWQAQERKRLVKKIKFN